MDNQLFDINIKLPIIKAENGHNGIVAYNSIINNSNNNDCNNNKQLLDLPKPSFRPADNYEYKRIRTKTSQINKLGTNKESYFHYQEPTPEELIDRVEYDMDDEDTEWLKIFNSQNHTKGPGKPNIEISCEDFEKVMDRLEKESYFESQKSGKEVVPEIDEDAVCAICDDGRCENTNVILFCDMCDLAVHQECYGVPYIPEGQWLCRRCLQSPSRNVSCVLCPNKGGAFKQTDDGQWAHVICALWVPEVCFANAVFLEPIDSIDRIPTARWKLCCYICKQKRIGACIQCHKPNCYVPFHVTCAQQAGLYMKISTCKYETPEGLITDVKKEAFCDAHEPTNGFKRGGMYSGDETDEEDVDTKALKKWKRAKKEKMKKTRKILAEKREVAFNPVAVPGVKDEKLLEISKLISIPKRGKKLTTLEIDSIKEKFIRHIKGYWFLKRQNRNGVPLLRRLQVSFTSSHSGAQWQNTESLDRETYKRLRYDLEKARLLVGEVKRRELLKKRLFKLSMEIVDTKYKVIDEECPPIEDD